MYCGLKGVRGASCIEVLVKSCFHVAANPIMWNMLILCFSIYGREVWFKYETSSIGDDVCPRSPHRANPLRLIPTKDPALGPDLS